MADEKKSLWEPEPDIFTDYEGTITEAVFKFGEYGGQFSITLDEIDGRDAPTWENYRLPPGWESNDGGETLERVAGDGKGFAKSSQYMKFLMAARGCEGAFEVLGEDAPVNANVWIGTRWRFEVTEAGKGKPYDFEDKDNPGKRVTGVGKDKNYPTAFLGKDASSASPAASSNGQVDTLSVLTTLNNPVVESQIQELAKTLDHKEWFAKSYALVSEAGASPSTHGDLITAMGGRTLYESLGGKG